MPLKLQLQIISLGTISPSVIGFKMLKFTEEITKDQSSILSPEVVLFVNSLCEKFAKDITLLLKNRGNFTPSFLKETAKIRNSNWKISPIPDEINDRRVEITGPPDRKMIINALNSGANVYMADFEDSNSPTWSNCINGQINLRDAVRKTITFYNIGD